jgi:hypothetical protein
VRGTERVLRRTLALVRLHISGRSHHVQFQNRKEMTTKDANKCSGFSAKEDWKQIEDVAVDANEPSMHGMQVDDAFTLLYLPGRQT